MCSLDRHTWNMLKPPKVHLSAGHAPQAQVERSHPHSWVGFCAMWSVSRATSTQETGTHSLPQQPCSGLALSTKQGTCCKTSPPPSPGQVTTSLMGNQQISFPSPLPLSLLTPTSYTRASKPCCTSQQKQTSLRQKLVRPGQLPNSSTPSARVLSAIVQLSFPSTQSHMKTAKGFVKKD